MGSKNKDWTSNAEDNNKISLTSVDQNDYLGLNGYSTTTCTT